MEVLIVVLVLASGQSRFAFAQSSAPTVNYWHVWTDRNGVSHQNRCAMRDFVLKSLNPPASPSWQDYMNNPVSGEVVTVMPVGWEGTWHENPKPQWIIPLSGRWFVQTMDGKRVEMGPGEISFGEDQNTKPDAQGHKGHVSGSIGRAPAVLMLVQLSDPPTIDQPCRLKIAAHTTTPVNRHSNERIL
jgi:hypothetical protein